MVDIIFSAYCHYMLVLLQLVQVYRITYPDSFDECKHVTVLIFLGIA